MDLYTNLNILYKLCKEYAPVGHLHSERFQFLGPHNCSPAPTEVKFGTEESTDGPLRKVLALWGKNLKLAP